MSNVSPPPPLPVGGAPVPPLPPLAPRRGGPKPWLIVLIVIGACLLALIGFIVLVAAYIFTASEFELTEEQREAVVQIEDLAAWFEFEVDDAELATWDCSKYIDGTKDVYYFYENFEEGLYLDCTLTFEHTVSDAGSIYAMSWQGLKMGARMTEPVIVLDEDNEFFSWGDQSRFAFQVSEGEINGFALIARTGSRVFFLDAWGVVIEDPEAMRAFLEPHLTAFEETEF